MTHSIQLVTVYAGYIVEGLTEDVDVSLNKAILTTVMVNTYMSVCVHISTYIHTYHRLQLTSILKN